MTTEQVRKAYRDKKDVPCQITERLIMFGYQQENFWMAEVLECVHFGG